MTRLRKMMLEELQRRNYSQDTTRHYIRTVEDFARRFNCPPDRLGPRHIREFQAELFQKRKLSPGTSSDAVRPCCLHASSSVGPASLAEQENRLRSPVPNQCRNTPRSYPR